LNSNLTIKIEQPTDTASLNYGSFDGYSFCGNRSLILINNSTGQLIDLTTSTTIQYNSESH